MNKTDAEIEKALECCVMGSYPACRECPYHDQYINRNCIAKRNDDIKDLINRLKAKEREQQAEIEILNHNLKCEKIHKESVIERYKNVKENLKAVLDERADHSEAIKEFAEMLCKDRVSNDPVVIAVKAELKMTEKNDFNRK